MLCVLAGIAIAATPSAAQEIVRSKEQVGIIGWRTNGKLLYHVGTQLREWPSGRTVKLPKPPDNFVGSAVSQNLQEPGGDRWLINGQIFDAHNFKFGGSIGGELENPFWAGGSVGHLVTSEDDHQNQTAWIVHKGQKRQLDGSWCYQAISTDGAYLSATRDMLFAENDLYILKCDPVTGSVKPVRKYPKAVDDHRTPGGPAWNSVAKAFLITLCSPGPCWTMLGRATLKPIKARGDAQAACWWIEPNSSLFLAYCSWESGQRVTDPSTRFPVYYADHTAILIQDARTGRKQTLIEATQKFVIPSRAKGSTIRAGSTDIQGAELDLQRRRLAYVIVQEESDSTRSVYSASEPRLSRLLVKGVDLRIWR
jgi:hypothetical protein